MNYPKEVASPPKKARWLYLSSADPSAYSAASNAYQQPFNISQHTQITAVFPGAKRIPEEFTAKMDCMTFPGYGRRKITRIYGDPMTQGVLESMEAGGPYELIISDFTEGSLALARRFKQRTGLPWFVIMWDHPFGDRYDHTLSGLRTIEKNLRSRHYRHLLKEASGVACFINTGVLDDLGFSSGQINAKAFCNGIDLPTLAQISNAQKTKSICVIGRVRQDKGSLEIIEAFNNVAAKDKQYTLELIGPINEGPDSVISTALARSPYRDRITVTGRIPYAEAMKKVAAASIGLHVYNDTPSLRWNHVLKIGEYHALKAAVICMPYPGAKDIATDGIDSIQLTSGSVESLTKALNTLIENEPLRTQLAERGYERAQRRSWNQMIGSMCQWIDETVTTV